MSNQVKARIGKGSIISDRKSINSLISRWHFLMPLLLSLSSKDDFKPIILLDDYKEKAFSSNKKKSLFSIFYSAFFIVLFLFLYIYSSDDKFHNLCLASAALAIYFSFEHLAVATSIDKLTQRVMLVVEISLNYKLRHFDLVIAFIFIGCCQIILNLIYGSFETPIYLYGAIYSEIQSGEWWRIATGSFFHSGMIHWIVNFLLLLFAVLLYTTITNGLGYFVFISGCVAGAVFSYISYYFGYSYSEAYVGSSAGIYSLLGYIKFYSYYSKQASFGYLHLSILNFLVLNLNLAWLLSPSVSNSAHIAGFMTGIALACFKAIGCNYLQKETP